MNELQKRRATIMAELKGLLPKVEAGDDEAVKRAQEIREKDIPALEKDEKQASFIKGVFSSHRETDSPGGEDAQARTIGAYMVNHIKSAGWRRGMKMDVIAPEFKAATDTHSTPSSVTPALTTVDTNVVTGPRQNLLTAGLFGTENISGTTLTYFVEGSVEGSVTNVAEGATKPQIHFGDPTAKTETLKKIAAYYKDTDELLEDLPWLAQSIDSRALYLLALHEEDQLLNGDGNGSSITGLLNRTGIQTEAVATGETNALHALRRAKTKVQTGSGFNADAIVLNPEDYQDLQLLTDDNGQYYFGGPAYGQYGNGGYTSAEPSIWGLRVIPSLSIAKGKAIVGAFKLGGSIIRKGGVNVETSNSNEDDFINNRITVRIEERIALAVRYPAAFVNVTLTAPSGA